MATFSGWAGQLRFFTILIGAIDFPITVGGFQHHYTLEQFFLAVVIICLAISCMIAVLLIVGLCDDRKTMLDIGYHIISAIVLLIGGICMLVSVLRFGYTYSNWFYAQRISSGILGIINSFIYALVALFLIRSN